MKRKAVFIGLILMLLVLIAIGALVVHFYYPSKYQNADKLISAIENEDVTQVKKLLDEGIDPNQTNMPPWNYSFFEMSATRPLSVACRTGNLEIIELLLTHGATVEYQEHTGWSPLKEALFFTNPDDLKIVELLLEQGADPNLEEPDNPLVFDAASLYPQYFVKGEYTTGYDDAAAQEITQMVELLLGNKNIDMQAKSGDTLLMCAARRGNIHLVHYLIDHGCSISIKNNAGQTAYDIAVECNKTEIAALLEP